MAFGITYELAIVLFIVVFGLLFVVGEYYALARPFLELTALIGLVILITGWGRKDYDLFFSGVLFLVVSLAMLMTLPSITGSRYEAHMLSIFGPILAPFLLAYLTHPIVLVILLILLAYLLSRSR